jgi:hypothetical protein
MSKFEPSLESFTRDWQPPKTYKFSRIAYMQHRTRFWRMPQKLVADGLLRDLWLSGHRTAPSLIPLLALKAFPGKKNPPGLPTTGRNWTDFALLSHRQIARVCGVHPDSVTKSLKMLENLKKAKRVKRLGHAQAISLHLSFHVQPHQKLPYAEIPGSLLYGGIWASLGSDATRLLYLIIAGLQFVRNERALRAYIQREYCEAFDQNSDDGLPEGIIYEILREMRQEHPITIAELRQYSGLSEGSIREGLKVLTNPLPNSSTKGRIVLVEKGDNWFSCDPRACDHYIIRPNDSPREHNDPDTTQQSAERNPQWDGHKPIVNSDVSSENRLIFDNRQRSSHSSDGHGSRTSLPLQKTRGR